MNIYSVATVVASIFLGGSSALGFVKKDEFSVMKLDFSRETPSHIGVTKRGPIDQVVASSEVNKV